MFSGYWKIIQAGSHRIPSILLFIIKHNTVQRAVLTIYQEKNFDFILWKQSVMNV